MPDLRLRGSSYQGVLINHPSRLIALVAVGAICTGFCQAGQAPQSSPPAKATSAQAPEASQDELSTSDNTATFKVHVNLVLVRVVVRDTNGKAIANLKKEDFQLADDRKPQTISSFSVETQVPGARVPVKRTDTVGGATPSEAAAVQAPEVPQRFVAVFVDDLHLSVQDTLISRQAATKLVEKMQADDRLAIFTTSGQVQQEFTADHEKLDQALLRIVPRSEQNSTDCPPMTLYEAYSIVDLCDLSAVQVATEDFAGCSVQPQLPPAPKEPPAAQGEETACPSVSAPIYVVENARRILRIGEANARSAFRSLDAVIRRMSQLPGERIIVMMSPGFFVTPLTRESGDVIDRATKANIVISTVDTRGVYVPDLFDASKPLHISGPTVAVRLTLRDTEETFNGAVLGELADGTGGTFFHNRNDIDQGLVLAAARPEVSYLLGFTPQNLKFDGRYHHLKVTLNEPQNWTLQARHGYFAPSSEADPEAAAEQEIQQAVFSRDEMREVPLTCQTQFFQSGRGARLSVIVHVTTRGLKFVKTGERSRNKLTVTTAIFDQNGNLLEGSERIINMQLTDATLARQNRDGVSTRFSFDVHSGTLLVRIVVRDSEGSQMGAISCGVDIPY